MVSRSDPGSFQRTTTCIWMPDVRLLHDFEPTQWGSVSGLDDGKRKTKRGWSPGDSLNLVRVLSVRVNYSQQCRNDINGRWEYSKSIICVLQCHMASLVYNELNTYFKRMNYIFYPKQKICIVSIRNNNCHHYATLQWCCQDINMNFTIMSGSVLYGNFFLNQTDSPLS